LVLEEFESITQRAKEKELEADIQRKLPKGAEDPPYVKENRPPLDADLYDATRATPFISETSIKENLDVGKHWIGDRFKGLDESSFADVSKGDYLFTIIFAFYLDHLL
jgi:hypothetical protein